MELVLGFSCQPGKKYEIDGQKEKMKRERCKILTASATPPSATRTTVTAYNNINKDTKREDRVIVIYHL